MGCKGGEEIFKFTRSAIAPEGTAWETAGFSAVVVGAAGMMVAGVVVVFGFLGSQALSSNPPSGFFSDGDSVSLPLVATALGLKAVSSTLFLAGFAGVGLVFLVVLLRIAPPGPLKSPPAPLVGVPSYTS